MAPLSEQQAVPHSGRKQVGEYWAKEIKKTDRDLGKTAQTGPGAVEPLKTRKKHGKRDFRGPGAAPPAPKCRKTMKSQPHGFRNCCVRPLMGKRK